MTDQAPHGEVKFKVRRNVLLLREFTIEDLVQVTGSNPESIRTEVQRLRQEEFVLSERRPGQRHVLYRLSDDPEKRLELSKSIEAFYPKPTTRRTPPQPTSRLYQAAVTTLDQAEKEKGPEQKKLLEEASHQLKGAWHTEGASRAPELVQAHILREQGRLARLQGKREQAEKLLRQAKEIFARDGLESDVRLINQHLTYLEARRRGEITGATSASAMARCVRAVLEETQYSLESPLVDFLGDLIESLLKPQELEARVIRMAEKEMRRSFEGMEEELRRDIRNLHLHFERRSIEKALERQIERGGMEESGKERVEYRMDESAALMKQLFGPGARLEKADERQ